MKYVKLFEELDYSTNWGKRQAQKEVQRSKASNLNFKQKFFEKYPKGTKLVFEDKEAEYELILDDIKFDESGFYLVFKAENGYKIKITSSLDISESDLQHISILPVRMKPESEELLKQMFEK